MFLTIVTFGRDRLIRTNIYTKSGPYNAFSMDISLVNTVNTNLDAPLLYVLTRLYCRLFQATCNANFSQNFKVSIQL